jgi:hypothetical protein
MLCIIFNGRHRNSQHRLNPLEKAAATAKNSKATRKSATVTFINRRKQPNNTDRWQTNASDENVAIARLNEFVNRFVNDEKFHCLYISTYDKREHHRIMSMCQHVALSNGIAMESQVTINRHTDNTDHDILQQ